MGFGFELKEGLQDGPVSNGLSEVKAPDFIVEQ